MIKYKSMEIERLQQLLLLLPNSKQVSTQSELAVVRCPLCGDSSHANSAHMYIGVKEIDDKQFIVYDCKICSSSGLMNGNILRRLGITDLRIEEYLKSLRNKNYIKTFSNEDDLSDISYRYPKPSKEDKFKVEYMNNRLQMDFGDYENIKKYRIIYNLSKFLEMNKITSPVVSKDLISKIDEQGVAFVSADKSVISVRNIKYKEYGIERFNIIHLYQNVRHPFYYMPPCNVDILSPLPHIVVSESSFNIINIQNYFYGADNIDAIFASASRKGCARVIENLISKSGFTGGKLEVYADNEKSFDIGYYKRILEPYMGTFDISIILNTQGKDFGEAPKPGESFQFKTIKI